MKRKARPPCWIKAMGRDLVRKVRMMTKMEMIEKASDMIIMVMMLTRVNVLRV